MSEANARGRWGAGAKRAAKQRGVVALVLRDLARRAVPCEVRIVRLGPGQLDDDNLGRACKAVRDEVSAWLGVDDNDPRVSWACAQQRAKEWAVRIVIRSTGPGASCAVVSQDPDGAIIVLRLTRAQRAELAEDLAVMLANDTRASVNFSLGNAFVVIAPAGEP